VWIWLCDSSLLLPRCSCCRNCAVRAGSCCRCGDEATSLVGVNLAGWFEDGSVTVMQAGLINGTGGKRVVGVAGRRGWLGGPLVFASLVQMAFDHCRGMRWMLEEQLGGEARKGSEVTFGKGGSERR
jgi:hypothetical protein